MAISGLVISTRTADQAAALIETLAGDVRFICGPRRGNRLAAVMDTTEDASDEDLCRWLWTLDGVVLVDVAAVHLTPGYQAPEIQAQQFQAQQSGAEDASSSAPHGLTPPTQPIFYSVPDAPARSMQRELP